MAVIGRYSFSTHNPNQRSRELLISNY